MGPRPAASQCRAVCARSPRRAYTRASAGVRCFRPGPAHAAGPEWAPLSRLPVAARRRRQCTALATLKPEAPEDATTRLDPGPPGPGVPGPGTFLGTLAQADSLRLRAYARESLTRCSNASRLVLGASDSCGMHMCLSVQSLLLRLSLSRQLQSEPRTARRPGRTRCMALRPQHEHRRRPP